MKDLADQIFLRAACAKIKRAAVFYQGNYKSPFSSRFKETKSLLFLTDSRRSRISYQYKWFKLVSKDTHTGETRFSYINGFMTIFSWVEKNNNSETNKNELNCIISIKFIFGNFKDLVEIYSTHFWLDISQNNARFSWVRFSNFTPWIFWFFCMNKLWNFASRFFHVLGKIFDFVLAKKGNFCGRKFEISNPSVEHFDMNIQNPSVVQCTILISNLLTGKFEIWNSNLSVGKIDVNISNPEVGKFEMKSQILKYENSRWTSQILRRKIGDGHLKSLGREFEMSSMSRKIWDEHPKSLSRKIWYEHRKSLSRRIWD